MIRSGWVLALVGMLPVLAWAGKPNQLSVGTDAVARQQAASALSAANGALPLTGGTLSGPLIEGGGNITVRNGYSYAIGDTTGGTTTYLFSGGSGIVSMVSTSGAVELDLTSVMTTGPVFLDPKRIMWVAEQSGKVVIGTGSTNLFSISSAGNVIAKGTITGSGSP